MIVIINGVAQSGKDTFVEYCKQIKESRDIVIFNLSYIDSTKYIAKSFLDWDGNKDEKGRKLLSELEKIRIDYNNAPFDDIVHKIRWSKKSVNENNIIFVHCRRSTEIKKLKDYYKDDCITLLIRRNEITIPDNESDQDVFNTGYDIVIENNYDLNYLKNKAKLFVKYVFEEDV